MAAVTIFGSGANILPLQNGFLWPLDNGSAEGGALQISVGTFTMNSGTAVTVANAAVTASSQILLTPKTVSGTLAAAWVVTITPGTGFTVNGGGSDTSVWNYAIIG